MSPSGTCLAVLAMVAMGMAMAMEGPNVTSLCFEVTTLTSVREQESSPPTISPVPSTAPSSMTTPPPTSPSEFRLRAESYIDTCLMMSSKFNIILDAYRGLPIHSRHLQDILDAVEENTENSSFNIPELIRLLYYNSTAMIYEADIKAAVMQYHFWLTHNDKNSVWWTENKSILYLSSHFLFNQLYGWSEHDSEHLRERLIHWLDLKINYGFYEFGSKVYSPYTLKGLLNLVDFCEDAEIITKATLAAQRLLRNLLLFTNDQGVSYSVATRDYWRVAMSPNGNNYNKLVYLLTGLGHSSDVGPSSGGVYLAVTSLDVTPVYTYWLTHVDISIYNGHPLEELDTVNSVLTSEIDRTLFQWVAGAYFYDNNHALLTKELLDSYDLWDHNDFTQYGIDQYESFSLLQYQALVANPLIEIQARGTVLTESNLTFYKDGSSMLSSMSSWHAGYQGHQAIPWMASTGQISVFGVVGEGQVVPSGGTCESKGLPFVSQSHNVVLAGYHPHAALKASVEAVGGNTDVLIHWPFPSFSETETVGQWWVSREDDSFIAIQLVYIPDGAVEDIVVGGNYIWSDADTSIWAVVVGNDNTHGTFDNFISVLSASIVTNMVTNVMVTSTVVVDGSELSLSVPLQ